MSTHHRRAKKHHQCDYCGGSIEPAEVYLHQSDRAFLEGTVFYSNIRAHLACAAVVTSGLDRLAELEQEHVGAESRSKLALNLDEYWQTGDARRAAVPIT